MDEDIRCIQRRSQSWDQVSNYNAAASGWYTLFRVSHLCPLLVVLYTSFARTLFVINAIVLGVTDNLSVRFYIRADALGILTLCLPAFQSAQRGACEICPSYRSAPDMAHNSNFDAGFAVPT